MESYRKACLRGSLGPGPSGLTSRTGNVRGVITLAPAGGEGAPARMQAGAPSRLRGAPYKATSNCASDLRRATLLPAAGLPRGRSPLSTVCQAEKRRKKPIFDRTREQAELAAWLDSEPASVTLVLGPRSAGKTAIMEAYIDSHSDKDIIYIDCRADDVQTPDNFAAALLKNTQRNAPLIEKLRNVLGAAAGAKFKNGQLTYQSALSEPGPPLITDEFNLLTSWGEEFSRERKTLLSLFVRVSKQRAVSHVVLASSDYASKAWLEQTIGSGFCNIKVIGDFEDQDARAFFDSLRQPITPENDEWMIDDKSWWRIKEVCGGNAGLLRQCALHPFNGDWQVVLDAVYNPILPAVVAGLPPSVEAGFTANQYAAAIKEILGSTHKAVLASSLQSTFGGGGVGEAVLQAMVKANLLAHRLYSDWANDIDKAVFINRTSGLLEPVVIAPTPAHFFCMQKLKLLPETKPGNEKGGKADAGAALDARIASVEQGMIDTQQAQQQVKKDITQLQ
ncbi:hypothetical protein WJX72_004593 [[Myrmecia] bisecta]|uniref:ATPase domain-containing protein n=1 Tax=[Myrmecia] bisecta TaxID=41462 RepID=A0AAW1QEY2_9CHLO